MSYPASFKQYCTALNVKLTALRKEILYILWVAKKPLKAYEILDNLLLTKSNATPPTVYRALIFFVTNGTVHKIESIQSYTLCSDPEKNLPSEVLMVCNTCHQVIEIYDDAVCQLLIKLTNAHQFHLKQDAIELKGICSQCVNNPKVF
jgi:Fur family zinc uptake transcriptional regulator